MIMHALVCVVLIKLYYNMLPFVTQSILCVLIYAHNRKYAIYDW